MSNTKIHEKTGIVWYRRVVPSDLRGRCPSIPGFADKPDRRELTKTLETRDEAEANRRAALIDIEVENAFKTARSPARLVAAQPPKAVARLTPQIVRDALLRWQVSEIEDIRLRTFNEEAQRSPFEAVLDVVDGAYLIQQYAESPVSNPDNWQRIPDYDGCLVAALSSQGIAISIDHPAVRSIRPQFAKVWNKVLRVAFELRNVPRGVWDFDDDDEVSTTDDSKAKGKPPTLTPFASYLDDWIDEQRETTPRQRDRNAQIIRDFAAFEGGIFIEAVKKPQVHRYTSGLIKDGGLQLTTKTVRNRLAALRSYWDFLSVKEIADDTTPFDRVRLIKRSGEDIEAYSAQQVVQLWQQAIANDDALLADLIRFAAFTGCRIESMTQLKDSDVRYD